MKTYKKGISLIVLVITVIVLAILATTVIVTLSNTNIITETKNAVETYNAKQAAEVANTALAFWMVDNPGKILQNTTELKKYGFDSKNVEKGYVAVTKNGVISIEQANVWDGTTIATYFAEGTGTENDPFQISTGAELAYFVQNNEEDKYYKLTSNIELNDKEFTPIGNIYRTEEDGHFSGVFDGNGKVISGLNVNLTTDKASSVGLFATVSGATIKNLTVIGETYNSYDTAAGLIGAIVGTEETIIENCHVNVNVNGVNCAAALAGRVYGSGTVEINNCTSAGTVTGESKVGGIVAINSASVIINNCANAADVVGGSAGTAGICSFANNNVTITNCTNSGNIGGIYDSTNKTNLYAAGILGYQQGTINVSISDCKNSGTINGYFAGGIYGAKGSSQKILISNCVNTGAITGENYAGGIASVAYGELINNKNTATVNATAANGSAGGVLGGTDLNGGSVSNSTNISYCSGGTANITAGKYAGRLVGICENMELSIDDKNGDDYTILPTVKAIWSGTTDVTKANVLTVKSGTLKGDTRFAVAASVCKLEILEGAFWDEFPGESGIWLLDSTWTATGGSADNAEWKKQ